MIFHEASNVGHNEYGDVKVKADDYDVNNGGAFCSWYNRSNCGNINWDYYGPLDPTSYQGLVSNTLADDLLYLMHMLQIRLMRHLQRMGAIFIRMYRYSLKQTKMDIMC